MPCALFAGALLARLMALEGHERTKGLEGHF
jgi:hypothetical protein